ncbi:hypothetical protein PR003_g11302 [Phytophthora rubi]|uniref:Uncharacterized protein n=1 Tax=Phytophthora rubi TaxID=129364 RepID=A0A6A4FLV1_9STRA|nr:hypothetical protein PR003_g11302 [Phytophthora rubi]
MKYNQPLRNFPPGHINRDDVRREFAVLNEPHHEPEHALEVLHPEEEDLGSIEDDAPLEEPVHGELPLDFPGQHDQQTTSDQLILQSKHVIIDDVEDQGIPRQDVQMRPPVVISDDAQESFRISREEVQHVLPHPVVIPDDDVPEEDQTERPQRDENYPYTYERIVRWIYNEDGGMDAEIQWHNTIELARNLTDEDRLEAQRQLRRERAQRREQHR